MKRILIVFLFSTLFSFQYCVKPHENISINSVGDNEFKIIQQLDTLSYQRYESEIINYDKYNDIVTSKNSKELENYIYSNNEFIEIIQSDFESLLGSGKYWGINKWKDVEYLGKNHDIKYVGGIEFCFSEVQIKYLDKIFKINSIYLNDGKGYELITLDKLIPEERYDLKIEDRKNQSLDKVNSFDSSEPNSLENAIFFDISHLTDMGMSQKLKLMDGFINKGKDGRNTEYIILVYDTVNEKYFLFETHPMPKSSKYKKILLVALPDKVFENYIEIQIINRGNPSVIKIIGINDKHKELENRNFLLTFHENGIYLEDENNNRSDIYDGIAVSTNSIEMFLIETIDDNNSNSFERKIIKKIN